MLYAFFWVIPPASEIYIPTFRNALLHLNMPAYEGGTDSVFRNVSIYNSDAEELPRRKHAEWSWSLTDTIV